MSPTTAPAWTTSVMPDLAHSFAIFTAPSLCDISIRSSLSFRSRDRLSHARVRRLHLSHMRSLSRPSRLPLPLSFPTGSVSTRRRGTSDCIRNREPNYALWSLLRSLSRLGSLAGWGRSGGGGVSMSPLPYSAGRKRRFFGASICCYCRTGEKHTLKTPLKIVHLFYYWFAVNGLRWKGVSRNCDNGLPVKHASLHNIGQFLYTLFCRRTN